MRIQKLGHARGGFDVALTGSAMRYRSGETAAALTDATTPKGTVQDPVTGEQFKWADVRKVFVS